GEVVYDRPETSRRPPRTVSDHLVIKADRFVRFFQVTSSKYSWTHNAVNLAYFVPLYLFGVVGLVHGWRSADRRRRSLIRLLALWIGVYAFFHALTVLDFDWRFRTPLIPHLALL